MGHWGTCRIFEKYGLTPPELEDYAAMDGLPFTEIVGALVPDTHQDLARIIPGETLAFLELESANPDTEMPPITVIAGMPEAILGLKEKNHKTGIVTNREGALLHSYDFRVIPEIGTTAFNAIVTGNQIKKPDPCAIWMAAEAADFHHGIIVMIGDTPTDIMAARNAGAVSIGVAFHHEENPEKTARLMAANPDEIIYSPDELIYAIETLAAKHPAQDWQNRYDATSFSTGAAGQHIRRGSGGGSGGAPGRRYSLVP